MAIDASVVDGVVLIRLKGELDHHVVEQIRNEIESALELNRYRGLVISFSGIDFMDSSGLGLILGRYRTMTQHQGKMVLCEVSSSLQKLFELSGILKIIPVFASETEALAAVKEA
ncbi:anti-sigma F factor antagonist [Alicyclobacillus cycloheptanicus]|uniref:Anti-sigma F factor antagonist n=1 Tax=Alicyclobacillus cycloheptanicus TaxID=1457 RepID=A0ABT9XED1_9BACL|nr:anti-sigma F factor antagonist [Alicyclobacillus cycloheptanicus]MDQ0188434.1 stage II sporulation protein AA (anti-sigma F factor antagonist) [Alicyclobacillus cycloheptanicus]WDM01134.1 anti-sigma F factor antagonist [Alicyclobacillus cycloheptanicus]